ncbi:G1/S-specific cyclin CCN1 [Exophiala dermatitidis]
MASNRIPSFGSNDSGYDSGIVEVFEEAPCPAIKKADHEKEVARHRQHLMASELSRRDAEDYQDDMLEHMLKMDIETMPDVDAIDIQTEIQWFMRPYLLDFLVEAHSAFQLLPETLFLAINLLDRYCSKRVVYKRHYQLVGCAALLIAAKYGDKKEKVPTIKELKSMCCSLYDDDMFLQMEWHVLSTLGWAIGHPTVDSFMRLAVKDNVYDPETESLTLYILEIALYHREFVSKRASTLALSALALARHILGRQQSRTTEFGSRYCSTTVMELLQKVKEPSTILTRKYASVRHSSVSRILTSYIAQRAASARAPITPTYDLTPPCVAVKPSGPEYFRTYTTPQKPHFPAMVQHGLYTPPITPEGEMFGVTQKTFNAPNQYVPPTPTPNTVNNQYSAQYPVSVQQWAGETY